LTWFEFFKAGLAIPAIHRCRTGILRDLLEQQPNREESDAEEVQREVDRRSAERVAREWMQQKRFPIVLACNNPTDKEPFYSEGLLCWFELRKRLGITQVLQQDALSWLQHKADFREALVRGLRLCGGGQELVIKIPEEERRPFSDEEMIGGESAGLAMAVWGSWYKRGVRPDQPIVISGAVTEDGTVTEVGYVAEKHSGARERGVNILVVPGDPGDKKEGLIRVPCKDVKFEAWLKRCEYYLERNGVKLEPQLLLEEFVELDFDAEGREAIQGLHRPQVG